MRDHSTIKNTWLFVKYFMPYNILIIKGADSEKWQGRTCIISASISGTIVLSHMIQYIELERNIAFSSADYGMRSHIFWRSHFHDENGHLDWNYMTRPYITGQKKIIELSGNVIATYRTLYEENILMYFLWRQNKAARSGCMVDIWGNKEWFEPLWIMGGGGVWGTWGGVGWVEARRSLEF